jgi:hypothetical protein
VDSFRAADKLMGTAFRQKLSAFTAAREQYIARHQHKNNPEWGCITKFSTDTGASTTYIGGISQIADNPEISSALENFSSVGYDTALALSKSDPEIIDTALEQLEQTGELTVSDISELSEHEVAQIERDLEREIEQSEREIENNHKKLLERIQPADSDISRFTHFLFSAGIQLDTYQQKTGEQLTADKIASFIIDEASKASDSYNGDPEIFADSIRDIRQVVDLFSRALELVSDRRPPILSVIK